MTTTASKRALHISTATLDKPTFDDSPESGSIKERILDLVKTPGSLLICAGPIRSGRATFMRAVAHDLASRFEDKVLPFEVGPPNGRAIFVRCDDAAELGHAVAAASERKASVTLAIHSQAEISDAKRRIEALSVDLTSDAAAALQHHLVGVVLCENKGNHFAYTFCDQDQAMSDKPDRPE